LTQQTRAIPKHLPPWFDTVQTKDGIELNFGGSWTCCKVGTLEDDLKSHLQEDFPKKHSVRVKIEDGCIMDTAGACLIATVIKSLKDERKLVGLTTNSPLPLLDSFLKFQSVIEPFEPRLNWKTRWLDHIGHRALILAKTTLDMLGFLGETLVTLLHTIKPTPNLPPLNIRWVSVFRHSEEIGMKALPIVGLISFLIGMVLSYQSINQLRHFGAELYTIDFLGISILREIAVLLTAIVIAGRSGSAFAAQIGTMALNQEIDAIRMLGLNPILVLVVPRLIAITVCLPILVFFAMMMGLLGGMVMVNFIIDVTPIQFSNHFQRAVSLKTFWVGMSKAPLFAVIIGLVGCFRGLQVKGSAESVGRMTTQSVVESIFLVIICDAFMSILFSYLKV
jgi:phospholipid/cholesterol/gamma-HCH transport system permease protein